MRKDLKKSSSKKVVLAIYKSQNVTAHQEFIWKNELFVTSI